MMLHPSYTDLMNVVNSDVEQGEHLIVNSRYSIVIATAKRARQIIDSYSAPTSSNREVENKINCSKALSVAIDELYTGKVKILTEDEYADGNSEQ